MVKEWSLDINTNAKQNHTEYTPLLRGRHLIHPKYRFIHIRLVDLTKYHNLRKDGNTSLTLHRYTGSVEIFLYFPIIIF